MSAATLAFGEPPIASPELALVDASLAAELRRSLPDPAPPAPRALVALVALPASVVDSVPVPDETETENCSDLIVGYEDVDEQVETEDSAASAPPVDEHDVVVEPALETMHDALETAHDVAVEPVEAVEPDPVDVTVAQWIDDEPDHGSCSDLIVGYDGDTAEAEKPASAYPPLPAPRFDTTEETDIALRRIQERLTVEPSAGRKRRLRRRFTIASGLVACASLAAYGAQVYAGLVQLPT